MKIFKRLKAIVLTVIALLALASLSHLIGEFIGDMIGSEEWIVFVYNPEPALELHHKNHWFDKDRVSKIQVRKDDEGEPEWQIDGNPIEDGTSYIIRPQFGRSE